MAKHTSEPGIGRMCSKVIRAQLQFIINYAGYKDIKILDIANQYQRFGFGKCV